MTHTNDDEPTRPELGAREPRAYDASVPEFDRWLCDYLRRTNPDYLQAMYRADFVPPDYSENT